MPAGEQATTDLGPKIEAVLREHSGGPAHVREIKKLSGGACQDIFRVDVEITQGDLAGARRFALRSDAPTSLAGSLDRQAEYEVIRAAKEAGVCTPAVHWLTADLVRPGAHAYFMDWVDGETIGRRLVRNPELESTRAGLAAALATELARIHSVRPETHASLPLPVVTNAVDSAMSSARRWVSELPTPHPALDFAIAWLDEHRPEKSEVTLVHGDFRTGNFMVTPSGLAAVLDWEFARWSDPLEDLGWLCVRDWRFGQLHLPAGGFARREAFADAYTKASGRAVDPRALHFWEVMGNVRWATGSVQQGERYFAGRKDIELIAIARRAVEMEYEIMRLTEERS